MVGQPARWPPGPAREEQPIADGGGGGGPTASSPPVPLAPGATEMDKDGARAARRESGRADGVR